MINLEVNKIKTYIGFAKKSKNIIYGVDDILKSKSVQLIIISDLLASSSKNKLQKYIDNSKIPYFTLEPNNFFEIIGLDAVKVCGITDKNLANAINVETNRKV